MEKTGATGLTDLLARAGHEMQLIAGKILDGRRLSNDEGLFLYRNNNLGLLGALATHVKQQKSNDQVFFNKNFHIEPTNICIYNCRFCSFACNTGDAHSWEESIGDIVLKAKKYAHSDVTEVHIVGGVHPDRDVYYYAGMLQAVRNVLPHIHIKAFSAIELEYMFEKAGVTDHKGIEILKQAGLQSIPGGGAEIFDETLRQKICPDKTSSRRWLDIHEVAHTSGVLSNATMLYGHLEDYAHRIDHLSRIRDLQDKTGGFNAFIPLKFRRENNPMSYLDEVTSIEDLKNYAVCRIFLDNVPHVKAYWPMIGKDMTGLALSFGADDVDGTIDDTTKIYSMAGADDQKPAMTTREMVDLINKAGYRAVERNSLYQPIREC